MKKAFLWVVLIILAVSMTACAPKQETIAQDESPITMFVALGNGEAYYRALAELIREKLGIEVEFVYQISCNTSDMTALYFKNNDLPADIVFTAAKINDALLKDSCVDLLSSSSVTAKYMAMTVQDCVTEDGAIYQLPISTRLIGITYNETLMKEMGWEPPKSFEDMVALKQKCDEAGVKFAVSDGVATGHGFNWLFHLMGSQWLSTLEGTEWFEGFQNGKRSVEEFKEKCDYFKRWTEAGLWGSIHNTDWGGSGEFSRTRALFWFGLLNTASGYQGLLYDEAGNPTDVMLNDTYKTIPWISENGTNNCYTLYYSSWVYVNKALEAPEKAEKLKKALAIIELLASEEATQLVADIAKDTYVTVSSFEVGENRVYAAYADSIRTGFVQPWYYNSFDADSISFTGAAVNAYLVGTGSYDDIFANLDRCNNNHLNKQYEVLADFPEGLGYEDTARLVAIAVAEAMNMTLEENGLEERVEVTLMPYTPGANLLPPWRGASVCNSVIYPGGLSIANSNCIFPAGTSRPSCVRLTGAEIKALTASGFDPSDRFVQADTGESLFDSEHYGPYPYVCLVQNGAELEDGREYVVSLCESSVTKAALAEFAAEGKLFEGLSNVHTLDDGLRHYCAGQPVLTPGSLGW